MQPHEGRPDEQRPPGQDEPTQAWQSRLGGDGDDSDRGDGGGHGAAAGSAGDQPTQVFGQPPASDYGETSRYGQQQPQYGGYQYGETAQYGQQQPQYGETAQFGQPQYGEQPSYGQSPPQYGQQSPAYGGGQYGQPQPQYGETAQYGQPQYGQQQPSYHQDQYGQTNYSQGAGYGQGSGYGGQGDTYGQGAGYGQAAYGQHPYGQPGGQGQPGAAPKKGHLGRWLGIAGAVVVVAVVAILLFVAPGFVVSKVLDPSAVAQTITSQSAGGNGDYSDVNCPSNEKVSDGNTFTCQAADGKQISVSVTSDDGDYTWEPAN